MNQNQCYCHFVRHSDLQTEYLLGVEIRIWTSQPLIASPVTFKHQQTIISHVYNRYWPGAVFHVQYLLWVDTISSPNDTIQTFVDYWENVTLDVNSFPDEILDLFDSLMIRFLKLLKNSWQQGLKQIKSKKWLCLVWWKVACTRWIRLYTSYMTAHAVDFIDQTYHRH